jgi:phosphoglycolate phosphatase-like HAD superfamily hydrolase
MKNALDSYVQVILWDFDGVLLDSNSVRVHGFKTVLEDFPENQVAELLRFHNRNGGLSRYVKFRYFFENIRSEEITNREIQNYADIYSKIMRGLLCDENRLIPETLDYVRNHYNDLRMHIVSGSDQKELRELCVKLGINGYFKSIHGSPTPKETLVRNIIAKYNYDAAICVLIGDSINDYEAAMDNNLRFICYNNSEINHLSDPDLRLF